MKVLVTGAFGYFGLALVQRLARTHQVLAVGRPPWERCASAVRAAIPANVEARECDVRDMQANSVADVDAVIHLAGGGAPGGHVGDALAALSDNVNSAARLALLAPSRARQILASTIYVYGPSDRPSRESDTLAPDTLYGQMKAVAEAVWHQAGGHSLRFSHIWGAGSGVDFGRDGATERLARAACGGKPFVMHGDGTQRLDLVHIDNVCEAVRMALEAPTLPPALNVGGGGAPTIWDLLHEFDPLLLKNFATHAKYGADDHDPLSSGPHRELDVSLARQVLGWMPDRLQRDRIQDLIRMVGGRR